MSLWTPTPALKKHCVATSNSWARCARKPAGGYRWSAMRNSDQKRTWSFIVIGLLALTFIGLVIAYKYTGDFSGLATLGTNRQVTPR
jgi:hypothetical protein